MGRGAWGEVHGKRGMATDTVRHGEKGMEREIQREGMGRGAGRFGWRGKRYTERRAWRERHGEKVQEEWRGVHRNRCRQVRGRI